MTTKTIARMIDEYGNAKFSDAWTPRIPHSLLEKNEAIELQTLIKQKDESNPRTAVLLYKLGHVLFANKWRPETDSLIVGTNNSSRIMSFVKEYHDDIFPNIEKMENLPTHSMNFA